MKNNGRQFLLVAESPAACRNLIGQFSDFLPEGVSFLPYVPGAEDNIALNGNYFIVFSGQEAYENFINKEPALHIDRHFPLFGCSVSHIGSASHEAPVISAALPTADFHAKYHFDDIIGQNQTVRKIKASAAKIAAADLSVLIEGEHGTGKELLAGAIHNGSGRRDKPFVSIHFSALSDSFTESLFFGGEENAASGERDRDLTELFRRAEGGTIFLDEVGEISLKAQAQILRLMQTKESLQAAGKSAGSANVRIIAASSHDLAEMVEKKVFRKDLYYRLKEGYLYLPPLSARKEDIPLLVNHWMNTLFCSPKEISPAAMKALMRRDWPGNVRELLNAMKFALTVSENKLIMPDDLPYDSSSSAASTQLHPSAPADDISMLILSAIHDINQRSQIAGRNRIYWFLREGGREVSEYKIRKHISALSAQGLISATHGKYGLSLTDKGLMILGILG